MDILEATAISKNYGSTRVLNGVDVSISQGEFVAVMGPSGSGKSTLLYSVSGMDPVDSGSVRLAGLELTDLSQEALADVRRRQMGFIFQQPALLKDLTILENIVLTSSLDDEGSPDERLARASQLMERTGIWALRERMTSEVSGGQLQRAGICRALMRKPRIVFGDEPTGALNARTASEIMDLLVGLHADGMTMLIVTHDINVAARAQRVLFMVDGRIEDELRPGPEGRLELLAERMMAAGI